MTEGGPGRASFMVIMYLYQTAWRFYRMGYGTAIAVGLALVILAFTLIQLRFFGAGADEAN
jgi:ABC-type sugar transport system permease subunit